MMAKGKTLGEYIEKWHVKKSDWKGEEELEVLGVSNIDGITTTSHVKSKDLSAYLVIEPETFAYNPYRINVGSIGLTPKNVFGIVSPAYIVFKVQEGKLIPELLLEFLKSFNGLQQINKYAGGTVRKALRFDDLCKIEVNFPVYNEQKNIFEKKLSVDKKINELESENQIQKDLTTQIKQAILQEAIQGKLTADWRVNHPNIESASELLNRIKAVKAQLIKDKKIKKEKTLPPITAKEIPFELPEGWVWCRLADISIHSLGKMLDKGKNKGQFKPYLRNFNVQWHHVDLGDVKEMKFQDSEIEKYSVLKNDILICEGGYPGRAAIWNYNYSIMFQKALHRVRFINNCLNSRLFTLYLELIDSTRFIENYFTGAGIQHLTGKSLHSMVIPVAPFEEQKAIVEKVESLIEKTNALETEITQSEQHAQMFMEAVLKEAFESRKEVEV
jgi:type I restriction enzyme, S subunit